MTPAGLHVLDSNAGIKVHVPPSEMKWYSAVLCNTAVGPRGILQFVAVFVFSFTL